MTEHPFMTGERVFHRQTKSSGTVRSSSRGHMGVEKVNVRWDHHEPTTESASNLVRYTPLQLLAKEAE